MTFNYHFAIEDPTYGARIFRRRIRLETRGATIVAGLEDAMHAGKLVVEIDRAAKIVRDIQGTWYRHPNLSCRGAVDQFAPFIGKPLTAERQVFRDYADPRKQCTHFQDLLGLALSHALRDQAARQYDVAVPDRIDGKTVADVQVDGKLTHRWQLDRDQLVGPEAVAGQPLEKGFSRWAAALFAGDALEAAHVLQMGIFVSPAISTSKPCVHGIPASCWRRPISPVCVSRCSPSACTKQCPATTSAISRMPPTGW